MQTTKHDTRIYEAEERLRAWTIRIDALRLSQFADPESRDSESQKEPPEVTSLLHRWSSLRNKVQRLRQVDSSQRTAAFSEVRQACRDVEDAWITVVSREDSRRRKRGELRFTLRSTAVLLAALLVVIAC